MLNKDQLREINKRANAATPGPWFIHYINGGYVINTNGYDYKPVDDIATIALKNDSPTENAALIVNSRTDIPKLLSYIRTQEAVINNLEDKITKYKPYHDAIMWLHERFGEARHWSKWCIEADDYSQYADDFLEAFENLKKLVGDENNG